jgi:predicted nucleotidyltransferase
MRPDDPILRKCWAILESLYGARLKGVVLYGSSARGTETEESDIDLMVLLEGPVNVAREIRRIWAVLYPAQLDCDRLITVMPADADLYGTGAYSLYRNVHREGVAV